jgi:hypothetical protein
MLEKSSLKLSNIFYRNCNECFLSYGKTAITWDLNGHFISYLKLIYIYISILTDVRIRGQNVNP